MDRSLSTVGDGIVHHDLPWEQSLVVCPLGQRVCPKILAAHRRSRHFACHRELVASRLDIHFRQHRASPRHMMDNMPRKRSHSLHSTPSISLKTTSKPKSKKHNSIIDISLDSTRSTNPIESDLCNAIKRGNVNEVENCLQNSKYEANLPNDDGELPLHLACIKGQTQIVELLIKAGAHINSMDKKGDTPLHLACRYADDQIVELLLKEFASTAIVNQLGWTALEEAEARARRDDMGSRIYHIIVEASTPACPTKNKEIAEPVRSRSRTYSVSLQKNQSFIESVVAWFRKL